MNDELVEDVNVERTIWLAAFAIEEGDKLIEPGADEYLLANAVYVSDESVNRVVVTGINQDGVECAETYEYHECVSVRI